MREVAQLVGDPACLSNTGSESSRVLLLSTDYCISVPQGCSELPQNWIKQSVILIAASSLKAPTMSATQSLG